MPRLQDDQPCRRAPRGRVSVLERRRLRVTGTVQGVGFRPFVYGLAQRHGIGGFVLNDGAGVVIEAEGEAATLDAFSSSLRTEAPPLARVQSVEVEALMPRGDTDFAIDASPAVRGTAAIPADIATCDDCLRELFDPNDRRYRYPFINCTQCGPRFTIVVGVPYDRPLTTMAGFPLCAGCRRGYEDPAGRRFRAEPIACPVCGPGLSQRSRALPRDARRRAGGDRARPPSRVPRDEVGARTGRGARGRAAPSRPRGGVPRRAWRTAAGTRARLRRHGLRHRWDSVGRRAAAV